MGIGHLCGTQTFKQVKHSHTLRKRKKRKALGVRSSGLSFVGLESSLVSCLAVCWARADERVGQVCGTGMRVSVLVLMDMVLVSENSSAALGAKCAHLGHRSEQCGILTGTPGWSLQTTHPPATTVKEEAGLWFL